MILNELDLVWNGDIKVNHAERVTSVQEKLLLANLEGSTEFVVAIEEVSRQTFEVLYRPRMYLPVEKVKDSDMVRVVAD